MLRDTGVYDGLDGRYAGIALPGGEVVGAPVRTGFRRIDQQLAQLAGVVVEQSADRGRSLFLLTDIRESVIMSVVDEGKVPAEHGVGAFQNMQAFLRAAATSHGRIFSPDPYSDAMWHTTMTRPRAYVDACSQAGGLIDHVPTGPDGLLPEGSLNPLETLQFLIDNGYEPDPDAWLLTASIDCGGVSCTSDDCTTGGPARFVDAPLQMV
jgi:hypothetical protein